MGPYEAAQVLGVENAATLDEIRTVYKRAAIKYHPDKSEEPDAEEKFKEASEAYAVLAEYCTGGGKLPVPRSVREAAAAPASGVEFGEMPDFVTIALQVLPGMGAGFGRVGSLIFEMMANGTVSRSGIEDIIDLLFEGGESEPEVVAVPHWRPRPCKESMGTLVVAPRAYQRYLHEADNGTRSALVFGILERPGLPPNQGTFKVQSLQSGVARIDNRSYRVEIKKPPKARIKKC